MVSAVGSGASRGPVPSRGRAPLVGRAQELAALRGAITRPPAIVAVMGEAGVGKTRLVDELMADPVPGQPPVLRGQCELLGEPLPLGPILGALRGLRPRLGADVSLSPVVGALAPLLPELADRLGPVPPPLDDRRAERHRVFRAAVELLGALGPLVVVCEDVHWADEETVELLSFLAAHIPAQVALVVTTRADAPRVPQLLDALGRGPGGPPLQIPLDALGAEDVDRLAAHLLGAGELTAGFIDDLCVRTGGLPFAVEEVLVALAERGGGTGRWSDSDLAEVGVPAAVRAGVGARLAGLDDDTRDVLAAAAVAGIVVDEAVVAAVTDRSVAQTVRSIGRATAVGLLVDSDGTCRFRHALAAQAVYESLAATTRRFLHRRTAAALASVSPPPHAQLAHHHEQAGDQAAFVASAEAAADLARTRGSDATAARFLLRAMAADGLDLDDRTRLARALGRAAVHGLAQSEAAPILRALVADAAIAAGARGELRYLLGRLLRQAGEARDGYAQIEASLADLDDQPDLQARALAILAMPGTVVDVPVTAHLERAEAAEVVARRASPEVAVAVQIDRTSLALETGDPGGWGRIAALEADQAFIGQPRQQARAYLNWSQWALVLGDVPAADDLLAKGRDATVAGDYARLSAMAELVSAAVDLAAGRWEDLEARITRIAGDLEDLPAAVLDAEVLLGYLGCARGDPEATSLRLDGVIDAAEEAGAALPLVRALVARSRLALAADDPVTAIELAERSIAQVRAKVIWAWGGEAVLALTDACVAAGTADRAAAVAAELATGLAGCHAPAAAAASALCRGTLAAADGDGPAAHRALAEGVEVLADCGLVAEHAAARERLGAARAEDDRAEAEAHLVAALTAYDGLDAQRDVARVCQTMRRLGIAVPYPWRGGRRRYGLALSPREREVADLAASGKTNAEIAGALFLSPRTVESHVTNALRKLGGQTRGDFADLLDEVDDD